MRASISPLETRGRKIHIPSAMTSLTRRQLLQRTIVFLPVAAGTASLLAACGGKDLVCTDVSGLTDAQRATRTQQEYVEQSPHGNTKDCLNCRFLTSQRTEDACGTCQLVPGPIHPRGYCKSWVQLT
jgi:hypothetical protein